MGTILQSLVIYYTARIMHSRYHLIPNSPTSMQLGTGASLCTIISKIPPLGVRDDVKRLDTVLYKVEIGACRVLDSVVDKQDLLISNRISHLYNFISRSIDSDTRHILMKLANARVSANPMTSSR